MSWTPRPWKREGLRIVAADARKTIVAEVTGAPSNPDAHADADLIVHAVNAHDALVAALKDLIEHYGKVSETLPCCEVLYEKARAALILAEGS